MILAVFSNKSCCIVYFQVLLSAAIACITEYHKDVSLSDLPNWDFDRAALFYGVFIIGLVIVVFLFLSFLFGCAYSKKCGSPRGWTSFVSA